MHEKRSTRFLVLTRAGGKPFRGARGTTDPVSLKNIGASTGISNQPSTNTTIGIYHEENKKTRIMTIKNKNNKQTKC